MRVTSAASAGAAIAGAGTSTAAHSTLQPKKRIVFRVDIIPPGVSDFGPCTVIASKVHYEAGGEDVVLDRGNAGGKKLAVVEVLGLQHGPRRQHPAHARGRPPGLRDIQTLRRQPDEGVAKLAAP